ncbi:MAG: cell division protein FtsK [Candidatus Omnitrophica bacterium CG11_big_fil_rev_8_21_14_0_20_45_26]|uniref:Cell division protein FtsK n=1 Tax=Candidatus Abzuiibacterium crystallinum TaxID=1974748 RepID=A0A2H0LPB1_9BACT|nr:MAG: cell division protein FtsK [Candidatus Omnitrophica bacterium CG11_big_fil_rev_8_21_14_0_20_45_26]PIW64295.1 MAG: cell division protein FtsK [Candidatus Omnitrophica bacterium CG12_big_fil_rev_8_21_14_0_65_45_16]
MKQERINEIYGVLFLLAGLFILIGLLFHNPSDHPYYTSVPNQTIENPTGIIGAYVAHYLLLAFGLSVYSVPFLFLFWSGCFFLQKTPNQKLIEFVGIIVAIFSLASLLALVAASAWKVKAGGLIGYLLGNFLEHYFGLVGGVIFSVSCLMLATLLFTDFLLYPIFEKLMGMAKEWFQSRLAKKTIRESKVDAKTKRLKPEKTEEKKSRFGEAIPLRVKQYQAASTDEKEETTPAPEKEKPVLKKITLPPRPKQEERKQASESPAEETIQIPKQAENLSGKYFFPSLDLLASPSRDAQPVSEDFQKNSKILEDTLRDFGIEVKVVEVEQGPVLTRYEIMPAPGVKVTRILSLSDDLALAMKATSIRIIAPIPGKSVVGIEVPNSVTTKVFLKELLQSKEYRNNTHKFRLPLTLGKDTSGKSLVADLSDMPHLLIAGTTGSGKTVCVNAIIAGLLYSKLPDNLKFVMIDPKMVELAVYNNLPHMLTPVVTDIRKAAATLNWVVQEMERRYKLFAQCGIRNIQAFNARPQSKDPELLKDDIPGHLAYIVVVIDELADLVMVAQDKVEGAITRLAQLSRAVGIHLILATQRPSVDVITGVIKANFPARISFKVASKTDSRTVLDANGADQLIGKGDMLFLEPGREKPVRGQAALVTDEEILALVDAFKKQGPPQYHEEIQNIQEGKTVNYGHEKDELYDEAVRVILESKQASVSILQRRLRLGYGRASRIIDMMEEEGIVGPHQGSKPREILVDSVEENVQETS